MRTVIVCMIMIFLVSCYDKVNHFTNDDIKTWLILDTSMDRYDHYKNGFVVMPNGYGIFITSTSGQEKISQPGLYDAQPRRLEHCVFTWEMKTNILIMKYMGKEDTSKITLLTNDTLKLESHGKMAIYIKD